MAIFLCATLALWLTKAVFTLILYDRLSSQLIDLGMAEARREICQRVNDELLLMTENGQPDSERLIDVVRNEKNEILSLSVNATEANRLRAHLIDRITKALEKKSGFTLSVPAGSLTDSGLLSWINFPLRVKYAPLGTVSGEILSEFTDGGVNQTRFRVYAEIRVQFTLLLPGENPKGEAVASLPLGEIVIVGNVPHLYGS